MQNLEADYETFLRPRLQDADPGHDLAHVHRVVRAARRLAITEDARLEIVMPAAWLHDCVALPKDSPDRAQASTLAARDAAEFLRSFAYPAELIPEISHAIEAHSFSADIAPRTLEARVVQDADRLEAIGAIGIARCFMVGGSLGSTLCHPDEPFPSQPFPSSNGPQTRALDDRRFAVDHFFAKLLGLAATFQTAAGRAEAEERTRFMKAYLRRLEDELTG